MVPQKMMTTTERLPQPNLRTIGGTFYRFHKVRYFTRRSDQFYKNFIDTRAKFESPARFAPAHSQCGHFFARTEQIACAEALFYADLNDWSRLKTSTPLDVIHALREKGDDYLFLAVEFEIDRMVDFTDWRSVDEFMRFGTLQWKGQMREYAVEYLGWLLSEDRGGNKLTDILGVDARSFGYKGVIFPSVRVLLYDGLRINHHLLGKALNNGFALKLAFASKLHRLPQKSE